MYAEKIMTIALALVIVMQLFFVWQTGRQIARSRNDPDQLLRHKTALRRTGVLIIPAVGLIELQSFRADTSSVYGPLLTIHLAFVALLILVGAATYFGFNGVRTKRWHRVGAVLRSPFAARRARGGRSPGAGPRCHGERNCPWRSRRVARPIRGRGAADSARS